MKNTFTSSIVMAPVIPPSPEQNENHWVSETRFGKWFLSTQIWYRFVLEEAIRNLQKLAGERCPKQARILDIGCGVGKSFPLLEQYFEPRLITAIDIDQDLLDTAKRTGDRCCCEVDVNYGSARKLNIPDNTFDIVFCHQLLHHITFREKALQEFYRILRPRGILLLSESCQAFLKIYWVRWLFRHPKTVQETSTGYIHWVRKVGFSFTKNEILEMTPWWSRRDFGLLEIFGLQFWPLKTTEIVIVATKPE